MDIKNIDDIEYIYKVQEIIDTKRELVELQKRMYDDNNSINIIANIEYSDDCPDYKLFDDTWIDKETRLMLHNTIIEFCDKRIKSLNEELTRLYKEVPWNTKKL